MKKAMTILLAVLLVPAMVSAANVSSEDYGVEETTSNPLSVISPTDDFKVIESEVTEDGDVYQVDAKVRVSFDNGDCNSGAIRQLAIGIDETVEPLECKNLGLGVCSPKEVDFSFTAPKETIDSVVEEEGQATLIAVKHSGWSCSYATNNYWDSENEGIKVHTFSPVAETLKSNFIVFLVVGVIVVFSAGYYIYKM